MNKKIILSSIAALMACSTTLSADEAELNKKISDLEERLDLVETKAATNKVDLGVTFRTRHDNVNYDKGTSDKLWTTKLNLNLKSKVDDNVKLTGRLTSYKNWGNNYDNQMASSYDSKQGRVANDSGVSMERAYADWTAIKGDTPVTLTIGRQASSDGPSWQFAENSVRKGTYDALLFDGAADGVVATVGLAKATGMEGSAVRFAYGKGVESESYKNATGGAAGEIKDNIVYGMFYEQTIPGFNDSLINLSYAKALDIVGDSNTGGASKNLGDMSWYGVAVEMPEVVSGLDVFAHYAHNKAESNGQTVNVNMSGINMNVPLIDGSGNSIWVGARYNAGFAKVGLEYNKGSEKWFSMTGGSLDPLNKLATRGSVVDAYIIKDIAKATHVKLGYMQMNYEYTGSGYHIGTPMSISTAGANETTKNIYTEFVINF